MAVGLIIVACAITAPINDGKLTLVVASYVAVTLSYTLWLKHEPVIDLVAVASGFVFRAIAGGVATGVPLSDWFLIVAGAGSLFIVTGKRHAEQVELGSASHSHRSTLGEYSTAYLGFVRAVSAGVMITAYCLWAFESATKSGDTTWFRLSIVPFVTAVLRYGFVIEQGGGGAPGGSRAQRPGPHGARRDLGGHVHARRARLGARGRRRAHRGPHGMGPHRARAPPPSSRCPATARSTTCSRTQVSAGSSRAGSAGATATPRRTPAARCSTVCRSPM